MLRLTTNRARIEKPPGAQGGRARKTVPRPTASLRLVSTLLTTCKLRPTAHDHYVHTSQLFFIDNDAAMLNHAVAFEHVPFVVRGGGLTACTLTNPSLMRLRSRRCCNSAAMFFGTIAICISKQHIHASRLFTTTALPRSTVFSLQFATVVQLHAC